MKLSFTAFILICLFYVSTASDLTDGATTGFIIGNIERGFSSKSDEIHVIEYYNFTRDTSLQKFPLVYNQQCIIEKNIIIGPSPTLTEKIVINIMFIFMLSPMIYMLCFADEETRRWATGYIIGRLMAI
jgi:hypothetical protein